MYRCLMSHYACNWVARELWGFGKPCRNLTVVAKKPMGIRSRKSLLPGITVIAVSQLIEGRRGRLGQTSPLSVGHPDTLGRPFDSDSALARITFQPAG
jgi:hypothetical protein